MVIFALTNLPIMKTLYIVRHAKSSWDHPGLPDYERPLLENGKRKTEKVIEYLIHQKTNPDLILSSHAIRAKETAALIAKGLSYPEGRIQTVTIIYQGNDDDLINLIYGLPNEKNSIIIVGHNPTFTSLANHFLTKPIDWLPTSGVVCVEFKTDKWENIMVAKKRTKFVISPKLIKAGKGKK
jgi:phosphohistidine phosphatase